MTRKQRFSASDVERIEVIIRGIERIDKMLSILRVPGIDLARLEKKLVKARAGYVRALRKIVDEK